MIEISKPRNEILKSASLVLAAFLMFACKRSETPMKAENSDTKLRDVTLTMLIESPDAISQITFMMKGQAARTDREDGLASTIHKGESGTFLLDHHKKLYRSIPFNAPDLNGMSQKTADLLSRAAKLSFTGRKMQIGRFECSEYVIWDSLDLEMPRALRTKSTAWIANDFEVGREIQARKEKLSSSEIRTFVKATTGKDVVLPGFAVRFETKSALDGTTTTTCESVSFEPLSDKLFEIPGDYEELQ